MAVVCVVKARQAGTTTSSTPVSEVLVKVVDVGRCCCGCRHVPLTPHSGVRQRFDVMDVAHGAVVIVVVVIVVVGARQARLTTSNTPVSEVLVK